MSTKLEDSRFDHVYSFSEGFAKVELDGKWNFINENGETK